VVTAALFLALEGYCTSLAEALHHIKAVRRQAQPHGRYIKWAEEHYESVIEVADGGETSGSGNDEQTVGVEEEVEGSASVCAHR
jgi:hypothetical protein